MSGESALASATREEGNKIIHRVKIVNLPSREMGTVKKLLQTYDLHKFKKAPKWDYAYMNFEVHTKKKIFKLSNYSHYDIFRLKKQLVQPCQN
jgi:hypothetical protein